MKTEPAMPLDVGAYLRDTTGLSRAEHGSYILLIMAYWANGGPLPSDDLSLQNTARCPDAEWERTKAIMGRFFDCSNGMWKHKRIDEEIARSKERVRSIAEASAKGVQARRELGQLPKPAVGPSVHPAVQRISNERELERVEKRLSALREQGTLTAGGPMLYSVQQRAEIRALKDRQEQLKKALGFIA